MDENQINYFTFIYNFCLFLLTFYTYHCILKSMNETIKKVREQKQESASYVAPKKTSKDDFFALEGKISLDNDDLTAFREDSFSGHKK